jgi:hypothetical protein
MRTLAMLTENREESELVESDEMVTIWEVGEEKYAQLTGPPVLRMPVHDGLALIVAVDIGSLLQASGITTTNCPLTGMGSAGVMERVMGE